MHITMESLFSQFDFVVDDFNIYVTFVFFYSIDLTKLQVEGPQETYWWVILSCMK